MAVNFDEILARVLAEVDKAEIGPATDVAIILHCTEQSGAAVPQLRLGVTPAIKVQSPNAEAATAMALSWLRGTIRDNISSVLRDLASGTEVTPNGYTSPVEVQDITLEVVQP